MNGSTVSRNKWLFKRQGVVHTQLVMTDLADSSERHGGNFPPTHWSLVIQGARAGTPQGDRAIGELFLAYRYPLYAFIRRRGFSTHDAEDLVQAFFVHLLQRNALSVADQARGRFRNFVLAALKNFLANERERQNALKRGGGCVHVSLNADEAETRFAAEPTDPINPDRIYDRNLAWEILDRVLAKLRLSETADGKEALFERLKPTLMGERLTPSRAKVAEELGTNQTALGMTIHRLRRRFRKLLWDEVAPMVATPDEVDDEIRYLLASLGD